MPDYGGALLQGLGAFSTSMGGMMIENARARAKQLREENFARFNQNLRREDIDYREGLARERSDIEYGRGSSGMVDPSSGMELTREEFKDKGGDIPGLVSPADAYISKDEYSRRRGKDDLEAKKAMEIDIYSQKKAIDAGTPSSAEKEINFLKKEFGEDTAKKMLKGKYKDSTEIAYMQEYVKRFYDPTTGERLIDAPSFQEFRKSFETTDTSSVEVKKQIQDLSQSILSVPPDRREARLQMLKSRGVDPDIYAEIEKIVNMGVIDAPSHIRDPGMQRATKKRDIKDIDSILQKVDPDLPPSLQARMGLM